MLRWFAVPALLLCLVPCVFAEGFSAFWIYIDSPGGPPLTTTCNGATPIPDGRIVRIFWDQDGDGADLQDPIAPLCNVPPLCEDGPAATFNLNEFTFNGAAVNIGEGYFYTEYGFDSHGEMPDPPRYFLRVYEPDGVNFIWTTTVKTMQPGLQEIYLTPADWTCGLDGPRCTVRNEHE